MSRPHYHKSIVPDYVSAAAEVFGQIRGDKGSHDAPGFVRVVRGTMRDLELGNSVASNPREVIAAGDGRFWDWFGEAQVWRARG